MFAGLDVSIFGLDPQKRSSLTQAIKAGGGQVHYVPTAKTTHLVVTEEFVKANPTRAKEARKKGHLLISPQYFADCEAQGERLDPAPFLVAYAQTERDALEVPNTADIPTPPSPSTPEESALDVDGQQAAVVVQSNGTAPVAATKKPSPKGAKPKETKWRSARVFISSTFRDMHGERDYLTRYVFPELQERCNKLRVHITPVDLRWGVTEEETQQALEICLGEIDNCRPFFIGLLGRRYGWCPDEYVAPDEPRYDWLRHFPSGYSITHLEMHYAVLRDPAKARGYFYMRDPSFERSVPNAHVKDFEAESFDAGQRMERLKETIKEVMPPQCYYDYYPCSWKGMVDGKPMVGDLERFGERVLADLWQAFREEFPEEETELDPLTQARAYHESFIESHARSFVGRSKILQEIHNYTESDVPSLFAVLGEPGGGKSSLVAAFAREYIRKSKEQGNVVIPHFVGAAPGSTNCRHTLERLTSELKLVITTHAPQAAANETAVDDAKEGGEKEDDEAVEKEEGVAEDYTALKQGFLKLLEKAAAAVAGSHKTAQRRLVLIIDALNQLDESYNAHSLDWLPRELPKGLRVVVSTLRGSCLDSINRRPNVQITVGPLDLDERKEIVRKTLWEYRKKLDDRQMKRLLSKKDAYKPLYLIVACEELRVFGVYELVSERIDSMADTVPALFEEVLMRLEKDHGWDLVRNALALLQCSRGGLLESEMVTLLSSPIQPDNIDRAETTFIDSLRNGTGIVPASVWSRLYRSLKPYLRPPGESGEEGVLDFFHQQLSFAVERRYLQNSAEPEMAQATHARLATYFCHLADPEGDLSWSSYHRRGMSEVAHHQTQARMWKELDSTLCDLAFIETKCSMGMTYDLVADYLSAAVVLDDPKAQVAKPVRKKLIEFQRFVQARAYILASRPEQTFAQAANLPDSTAPASKAMARWYAGKESRPWLKWANKTQTPNPCIMTLAGHGMVVRRCQYSPLAGSNRILSCSDDNTLKIFDSRTGAELTTLNGHTSSVLSATYSPDGRKIASSSWNKQIKVWNAETGVELATITGHKGVVTQVRFTHDGRHIVSCSLDKTVRVFSADTYTEITAIKAHSEGVNSVACSPDGKSILSASTDKTIKKWNWGTWDEACTFSGHTNAVNRVAFSPDGSRVVSGSDDRSVRLWSADGSLKGTLTGHKDGVAAVSFSHDGKRVVSSSHDNMIIVWAATGSFHQLAILIGHTGTVFDCSFSPDDSKIVSASFDRTVKMWECDPAWVPQGEKGKSRRPPKPFTNITGHTARILNTAYAPNGQFVATASRDKTLKVWNAHTGVEMAALEGHKSNVFACDWSPDSQKVVSASRDNNVGVWIANTGQMVGAMSGHTGVVLDCSWSPDNSAIVSTSADKTIRLWCPQTQSQVGIMYGHREAVNCCAVSPDGRRVVTGSDDRTLKLWDMKRRSKLATFSGHQKGILAVAFSPDSKKVVSGGNDKLLIEWSAVNAKKLAVWTKHKAQVTDVAYSPNGQYIVSGSTDNMIIIWDAHTKQEVCAFTCLSRVTSVSTSPEGLGIAVGDGSGTFYIFTPVGLSSTDGGESDAKSKQKEKTKN